MESGSGRNADRDLRIDGCGVGGAAAWNGGFGFTGGWEEEGLEGFWGGWGLESDRSWSWGCWGELIWRLGKLGGWVCGMRLALCVGACIRR